MDKTSLDNSLSLTKSSIIDFFNDLVREKKALNII